MRKLLASFFEKDRRLTAKGEFWWRIGLLGLAGILLLVVGSVGSRKAPSPVMVSADNATAAPEVIGTRSGIVSKEEEQLAEHLAGVLRRISGAGAVEVTIRLAGSTRKEYAVNTNAAQKVIEEKETSGPKRVTTEHNTSGQVVLVRAGQTERAVVKQEEAPRILGVLVVAEGAIDPQVRAEIFRATRVALGVEAHRVTVLPGVKVPGGDSLTP